MEREESDLNLNTLWDCGNCGSDFIETLFPVKPTPDRPGLDKISALIVTTPSGKYTFKAVRRVFLHHQLNRLTVVSGKPRDPALFTTFPTDQVLYHFLNLYPKTKRIGILMSSQFSNMNNDKEYLSWLAQRKSLSGGSIKPTEVN